MTKKDYIIIANVIKGMNDHISSSFSDKEREAIGRFKTALVYRLGTAFIEDFIFKN